MEREKAVSFTDLTVMAKCLWEERAWCLAERAGKRAANHVGTLTLMIKQLQVS